MSNALFLPASIRIDCYSDDETDAGWVSVWVLAVVDEVSATVSDLDYESDSLN